MCSFSTSFTHFVLGNLINIFVFSQLNPANLLRASKKENCYKGDRIHNTVFHLRRPLQLQNGKFSIHTTHFATLRKDARTCCVRSSRECTRCYHLTWRVLQEVSATIQQPKHKISKTVADCFKYCNSCVKRRNVVVDTNWK